jgi:hypothetical protein
MATKLRAALPSRLKMEKAARAIRRFGAVFINRKVPDYGIGQTSLMRGTLSGQEFSQACQLMYQSYRRSYGSGELLAIKVLSRTVGWLA